jgi:hypothetical protein
MLAAGSAFGQTAAPNPQFGEYQFGDVRVSLHGGASMGTEIRAATADEQFVTIPNGAVLGFKGNGNNRNGDDGEQNFLHRGDIVSSPLQAWGSVSATYGQYGMFALARGWYDITSEQSDVPWGNYPNGLHGGRPLSDNGFESRSKFGGLALQEAYVFGQNTIGGHNLYVRFGNQYIPWGIPSLLLGSLDALNPIDYPALYRPGSTYAESLVPVPALFLRFAATPKLSVEGFWQFAEARNAYPGCGTLFAIDYFPQGCNLVLAGAITANDRQLVAGGASIFRVGTPSNPEAGQGGIGAKYTIDSLNSVAGLYYAHYNSRAAFAEVSRSGRLSTPFIPGDPDLENPVYRTVFPTGIDMIATNWQTTFPSKTQIAAEYAFRPNQPVGLAAGQLLTTALTPAPSLLRADYNAVAPGEFPQGFDRLQTGSLNLSVSQQFPGVLGAQQGVVGLDFGVRSVYDLPSQNVRQYGRADTFGPGPINGVCAPQPPGVNYTGCTTRGFVSSNATGFRLRGQLTYTFPRIPDLVMAATLIYGRDISGWSYDGTFNEGRNIALARLHFDYKQRFFYDAAIAGNWGGDFNPARDRTVFTLQGGIKF